VAGAWDDDDDDSFVGAWVWLCCFETKLFLIFLFLKKFPTFSSRNYLMSNHSDKYDIWKCIWKCRGKQNNGLSEFSSLILNNKQWKNPHWLMSAPTSIYFVNCGFFGKKCVCVCVFQVHDCSSLKFLRHNCHVED
jgi:hypothetical protein